MNDVVIDEGDILRLCLYDMVSCNLLARRGLMAQDIACDDILLQLTIAALIRLHIAI